MSNTYFQFKQFTVQQNRCAMKVTTDGCFFGAWCAVQIQKTNAQHVLDIGAGSGLLSLMIAQKNLIEITPVEIDEDAAAQAGENISASPWAERISIVAKDILTTNFASSFDIIVSNPPFYENELPSEKETKNKAHHSYALTLKQLFSFAQKNLSPGGKFFVMLPYKRVSEIDLLL
ncbi:MAG: methyltransferase, partial [Bacteroidota bacterium]